MPSAASVRVVGIDLAASPRRPSGICILRGWRAETSLAFNDDQILQAVRRARPDLVTMDAPLSLPKGRRTLHGRADKHFRASDRALLRLGVRVFPVTLGPMRMLTARGLALKQTLQAMGYRVVECYPGAAQDLWGLPRQQRNRRRLRAGLFRLGVKGLRKAATGDELDAATAALTGRWLLFGRGRMLGGRNGILIPAIPPRHTPAPTRRNLGKTRRR